MLEGTRQEGASTYGYELRSAPGVLVRRWGAPSNERIYTQPAAMHYLRLDARLWRANLAGGTARLLKFDPGAQGNLLSAEGSR